jgi:polyhydroxyalkanoate synthesis regulator phasin
MDVTVKVKLDDGRIVSLSDFVSNDVAHATETYNRSVFGALAEKQLVEEFRDQLIARGKMTAEEAGTKMTKWSDVIKYVTSSAEEGRYVTSKEVERTVASLQELHALLRHAPITQRFECDGMACLGAHHMIPLGQHAKSVCHIKQSSGAALGHQHVVSFTQNRSGCSDFGFT